MKTTRREHIAIAVPLIALAAGCATQARSDHVGSSGAAEDRTGVLKALRSYLAVVDRRREDAIAQAFHPNAFLMSVTQDGRLNSLSQADWWSRVSTIPANAPPRTSTIVFVDVAGSAAVARIDITNGATGVTTTDYFNLMKVEAGWRIVNKTLSAPL